MSLKLFDM